METIKHIFVYGTLKVGGRLSYRHDALRGIVQEGIINGDMYSVGDSYPAVVNLASKYTVRGEVHEYPDIQTALAIADMIESCNGDDFHNLYNREVVNVHTVKDVIPAWVYVFNIDISKLQKTAYYSHIKNGVWDLNR